MTSTAPNLNIHQCIADHLGTVFDTMLSMTLTPASDPVPPHPAERVTGTIGFGGETVTGSLYLHLSAEFARQVTTAMLGMTPEEVPGHQEVNDVVGELSNMVAGHLKSALCDAGATCAVSAPGIIRGTAFEIETLPDVTQELIAFDCQHQRVVVELHIKFN